MEKLSNPLKSPIGHWNITSKRLTNSDLD